MQNDIPQGAAHILLVVAISCCCFMPCFASGLKMQNQISFGLIALQKS